MYSHILVPVDLAEDATYDTALNAAKMLLSDGGKISLLHVVEPIPTYAESYLPADFNMTTVKGAKERLGALAKEMGLSNTAVVVGSAGRTIVDWAEENDADCIVITSHKPAFSDIFLGSTATWVVKHCPMALHVLR
ncbi:MAG: universal stress protein [Pseudomonadota bacterium]